MKVLIKTLNLYNWNYGGIVQAYALQQVLRGLGVEAWTDVSSSPTVRQKVKDALKPTLRRLGGLPGAPLRLANGLVNAELDAFIADHIRTTDLYRGRLRVTDRALDRFDGFVVGSDQVWRTDYGEVPSHLLDFAVHRSEPKVAYAASFGTSGLDGYSSELRTLSRELAQHFTAVSVREASAVDVCRREWGVEATHVLDPTMLLGRAAYDALIDGRGPSTGARHVYDYTLDPDASKAGIGAEVAARLGLSLRPGITPGAATAADFRRDRARYTRQPVEEWLRGFRDADFVVTDSFHGTVFAILFEKPFIAVVNDRRGADRFHSLGRMLGVEDRFFRVGADLGPLLEPMDWGPVRQRLAGERARSMDFLGRALGVAS